MGFLSAICKLTAVLVLLVSVLIGSLFSDDTNVLKKLGLFRYLDTYVGSRGGPFWRGLLPAMHEGTPWGFQVSDIPDLTNQTILITGGNAGLGYWSAHHLASHGANVVIACRSAGKCAAAANKLEQETGRAPTMPHFRIMLFFLSLTVVGLSSALTCPEYQSIADPSVSPANGFSMSKLDGVWHVLATTEPTMPESCRQCGVLNFTVYEGGAYRYQTTANCLELEQRLNVTLSVGGNIGGPTDPGNCVENAVAFNHTLLGLMPNMFFNFTEDWYMSYACGLEAALLPIQSFFLATRSTIGKSAAWIQEKIKWAKASGELEGWDNLVITDEEDLQTCWEAAVKSDAVV